MPKINLGKVVGDKGEPFTFNDFTTEQLDGITPKILKGNVTTLDPDENAIVDIRKDGINNYIDFGIPRGKNGSELKDVSSENVVMADKTTLESTMTTVNENVSANSDEINKIKSPTFNDTVSTYSTLNDANTAAETTSNAIKSKVSIFTTLSNIKKSFSAIVQGLKILGTNVGAITGITSDLAGESETVAASIKAVNALNSNLSNVINPQNVNFIWNDGIYDANGYGIVKRIGQIIIGTISTKNLVDIPSNQMIHVIAGIPKTLFPVFAAVRCGSKSYVAYIDNATDYGDFGAVYFPYYNEAIAADTNIAMSFVYISQ